MTQPAFQTLTLPDTEATSRLADALAALAAPGVCVLLDGPVGAGKTFLARGVLHALMRKQGQLEDVPSPTFTLVQTYVVGGLEVWHADLYRLTSPDELIELGLDTAFDQAFCIIEWPDRMGDFAPDSALRISLAADCANESKRTAQIQGPPLLLAQLSLPIKDAAQ